MTRRFIVYRRHLLRINLSDQTAKVEEINPQLIRNYMGGRGLGARLLYDEIPPSTDPIGEGNKLIFTVGPLQGTHAPGQSRYCVATKSPQTLIYLMGLSASAYGPAMAQSGFQAMIIEGKAESPVYLQIDNDRVQFRDAKFLWGVYTHDTHEILLDRIGHGYEIASVGPAAEKGVLYSGIFSNRRAVGRGGAGAVMASKNLKAIAIRGSGGPPIMKKAFFYGAVREAFKTIESSPSTSEMLRTYGSNHMSEWMQEIGGWPTRNFQVGQFEGFSRIGTRAYAENYVIGVRKICSPCTVRCSKYTRASDAPYHGTVSDGPEFEAVYAFGSCAGNDNFSSIIAADKLCDDLGLDCMSAGNSIAFAIECFEKGYLTEANTDGLSLRWGDHRTILELVRKIAYREGFGDFLAQGTQRMAEKLGRDATDFAMHVKGLELGGYDPRSAKGMALTYACGNRGGCHHAGGHTIFPEVYSGQFDRLADENKGAMVKQAREKRTIADSSIICTFNMIGLNLDILAKLLNGATGYDFEASDMEAIGDRVNTVERAFNVREGIRRKHDTLPRRLTHEPMPEGPSKGSVVNLDVLLDDFYEACGYDLETGIPLETKMRSLGIDEYIIRDMQRVEKDPSGFWMEHRRE